MIFDDFVHNEEFEVHIRMTFNWGLMCNECNENEHALVVVRKWTQFPICLT